MAEENGLQKAGSVNINDARLITTKNIVIDLTDFISEINIYEDMFSSHLYGDILISDSRNIIEFGPIIGEEYLTLEIQTPSFPAKIKKTFRVFKISNRQVVRETNTQIFVLHFASVELFFDMLLPLFVSFEGRINEVALNLFDEYIATARDYDISEASDSVKEVPASTPFITLNETENSVKFVSPGWTPFKCLNWLASKAIPKNGIAKNYLFFESNKAFYFGSVEHLFKDAYENNNYIGKYFYGPSNIRKNEQTNVDREFFITKNVEMVENNDAIKNYTNGFLANRLITLDVYNKIYKQYDYDYTQEYKGQYHTSGIGSASVPVFTEEGIRNPATNISFYPINPKLYNNFPNNISEKISEIYGNRKSSLLDLTNIKLHLTVPGRTDIEVGNILYFSFPQLGPVDEGTTSREDRLYSGFYLITAIHHRITKADHTMVMEVVKDSLTLLQDAKNIQ